MRKDQVDLANRVIFISGSKTPTGVAEVPLRDKNARDVSGFNLDSVTVPRAANNPRPTIRPK